MAPQVNMTGWMDGFFTKIAEFAPSGQRPAADALASNFGMEGLASVVEAVSDLTLTPLGSLFTLPTIGVITSLVGLFAPGMNSRLRQELIFFANHNLFRVLDPIPPTPAAAAGLKANVASLIKGVDQKDITSIRDAFLKSLEDIKGMLQVPTSQPAGGYSVQVVEVQAPTGSMPQGAPFQAAPEEFTV